MFEKYTWQGEDRHKAHFVGKAVPSKSGDGLVLYIPKGISITGRVLLSPENSEKNPTPELVNDYKAAADFYAP